MLTICQVVDFMEVLLLLFEDVNKSARLPALEVDVEEGVIDQTALECFDIIFLVTVEDDSIFHIFMLAFLAFISCFLWL